MVNSKALLKCYFEWTKNDVDEMVFLDDLQ